MPKLSFSPFAAVLRKIAKQIQPKRLNKFCWLSYNKLIVSLEKVRNKVRFADHKHLLTTRIKIDGCLMELPSLKLEVTSIESCTSGLSGLDSLSQLYTVHNIIPPHRCLSK